jgi:neutral ceramidase
VIGNCAYAGMPAEYFSQLGLRIKEECYPVHALVVGQANGMIGYVPHRDAFRRGGYETTLCNSSRMAPEAGDLMADAAVELVRGMAGPA